MLIHPKIGKCLLPALVFISLLVQRQAATAQGIQINVVLTRLDAGGLDDGRRPDLSRDRVMEAYGTLTVGPVAVRWNNHTCEPRLGRGCLITTPPPYTTDIASGRHFWSTMFLRFDARGFRTSNNVIFFVRRGPTAIAQPLTVSFQLKDHDDGSPDDTWCRATNFELVPAGLTAADWLSTTRGVAVRASGPDGFCTIGFRLSAQTLSVSP
jgi:hypothetical protein